jgi:hypothetical protein
LTSVSNDRAAGTCRRIVSIISRVMPSVKSVSTSIDSSAEVIKPALLQPHVPLGSRYA